MGSIASEKLAQAGELVASCGFDVWMTFVRETAEAGDPVLPLILEGGLTWQSALLVTSGGRRTAIVGRYDADPVRASGDWDEVVGYDQGIREPLLSWLETTIPALSQSPRIAINFSKDDDKADGLSHGMYLLLAEMLRNTRFADALVSAEELLGALRAQKSGEEVRRIRGAIAETDRLFDEVGRFAVALRTEREIYDFLQARIDDAGLGYAWDRTGNPIVNIGPDSMIGHGIPSPEIALLPGQILHIDLGVVREGYASDMQRCWFLPQAEPTRIPEEIERALAAVNDAISAGAATLRPGMEGWRVDAAGRAVVVERGYPEYKHALGHQVGRTAHDGGTVLGPRWERYGRLPCQAVQENEVYTLELGVPVDGRGYLGIEEMVRVTAEGCEWLTKRQQELRVLTH